MDGFISSAAPNISVSSGALPLEQEDVEGSVMTDRGALRNT